MLRRFALVVKQQNRYNVRSYCVATLAKEQQKGFSKILIANRGEIACRVVKTAREMGVKTVAVFSDADKNSMHVKMADEAYNIGPAPSQQSYLNYKKILEVAKESGAEAIHPGYGFLSENADFANSCKEAGVEFIGPPASAINSMGSKSEAKDIMSRAKVPLVGGYHGPNQDPNFLEEQSDKIGYPVLIKAVLGGGGKGMRVVNSKAEFQEMLASAKREAMKSFNDDVVLVEKYLVNPRHVEVQVFADKHGNCVYLYERDCSIQRRHQKIIEEAPAPGISEETRTKIGEAAVRAAQAVNYVGAGTVEFIMSSDQTFYFMEMNTRLQVEHPVTEYITGTDLVEWQLKVASGGILPLQQSEIKRTGHSFEARIYAEDPENDFLPVTGKIEYLKPPPTTENVRIDTGVRQNDVVSVYYDPMIAKLVVWGEDRSSALRRLVSCLSQYQIAGLRTNIDMVKTVAEHPAFVAAEVETGFIERYKNDIMKTETVINPAVVAQAALAKILADAYFSPQESGSSPWYNNSFRLNENLVQKLKFKHKNNNMQVSLSHLQIENEHKTNYEIEVDIENDNGNSSSKFYIEDPHYVGNKLKAVLNGHKNTATVIFSENSNEISVFNQNGDQNVLEFILPAFLNSQEVVDEAIILSPMSGKVEKVLVKIGDKVSKGDPVVIVEAMKMEHILKATVDGVVEAVGCGAGEIVNQRQLLVKIDEGTTEP